MEDPTNPASSPEDKLSSQLAELNNLIAPYTEDIDFLQYVYYLLLLWGYIRMDQLEPYAKMQEAPTIIPLSNGRIIMDYGNYLVSSSGEDYGSYSTGKMIETSIQMFHILRKRGAQSVSFIGQEIAQRAAWIESLDYGVDIWNFYPTDVDWIRCEKVRKMRQKVREGKPFIEPDTEPRPF
jgi:hypothetical protein